ncbi:MAG: hypothetical protein Q8S73_17270 [Deltaproteobacteria bacterium]|nr:hypothetical protein [Deltaproteobacteria bacterium]
MTSITVEKPARRSCTRVVSSFGADTFFATDLTAFFTLATVAFTVGFFAVGFFAMAFFAMAFFAGAFFAAAFTAGFFAVGFFAVGFFAAGFDLPRAEVAVVERPDALLRTLLGDLEVFMA